MRIKKQVRITGVLQFFADFLGDDPNHTVGRKYVRRVKLRALASYYMLYVQGHSPPDRVRNKARGSSWKRQKRYRQEAMLRGYTYMYGSGIDTRCDYD